MLHLLPEQHKKKVLAEYRKRVGIVASIFAIFLSVAGIVLLIPSYTTAHNRYDEAASKKDEASMKLAAMSNDTTGDIVKNITDIAVALAPLGASQGATDVFNNLLSQVGQGVHIIHLGYTLNSDNTLTLDVGGLATTRDSLIGFVNTLTQSGYFIGASVPLSSLVRDKDISFQLKLGVKGDVPAKKNASTTSAT